MLVKTFYLKNKLQRIMAGAVFLKGERIELKTIEEEDIPFMVENINDPDVWSSLTIHLPANKIKEREFFKNISKTDKEVHLMICDDDKKIGMVSIFDIDHRVRKVKSVYGLHQIIGNKAMGQRLLDRSSNTVSIP